ncbi:MAG TPA: 3-hydroxyacyl-ACP dehydratase FabZ [Gammaproteobacteria bacterium]|nr:3-hydroxyacyl-ACP dehydratase FabZ [Gammaproteobacteria bacterium]
MIHIDEIQNILPHRYPFLLVDRVDSMDSNSIRATKCVTVNEPFFTGHFTRKKIMPGVLIIEALAQCAGILLKQKEGQQKEFFLGGIDKSRFRSPVIPGMSLDLYAELEKDKQGLYWFSAEARYQDEVMANAKILLVLEK